MSGKESKKINIYVEDKSYWLFSQWGKLGGSKFREMMCYGRVQIVECTEGKMIYVSGGYMPKHVGTGGSVDADNDDLVKLMFKLDAEGIPPDEAFRCWVHSHPGTGEKATYLSGTDDDNIERQLLACDFLVSIVFDSNGGHPFCRFDWKDERFGRLSTLGNIILMSGIQASSLDGASVHVLDALRFYNLGKEGIEEAIKIFGEKSNGTPPIMQSGFPHNYHNFDLSNKERHLDDEEKKRNRSIALQGNGGGSAPGNHHGGPQTMGTNGSGDSSLIRAWEWDSKVGKNNQVISDETADETASEMFDRMSKHELSQDEIIELYNGGYDISDFSDSEREFLESTIGLEMSEEETDDEFLEGSDSEFEPDDGLGKTWGNISQKDFDELVKRSKKLSTQDDGVPDWTPTKPNHNED